MTEANEKLMEILKKYFNLTNLIEGRGQLEFDYKEEHILCGLVDETKNGYVFFDYKCWFWSKGDYEKVPNRLGRGKDLCLYIDDKFENRIIDFFKTEVLENDDSFVKYDFTENWKNLDKPLFKDELEVKTCIEPKQEEKKKDEPLTLFDFM